MDTQASAVQSSFSLRRAVPSDYCQLQRIYVRARRMCHCFDAQLISMASFQSLVEGEELYLAQSPLKTVMGFISICPEYSFVHHLYTDPDFQRLGVASALLAMCQQHYPLPLQLKCLASNHQALSFYHKRGWLSEPDHDLQTYTLSWSENAA